MQHAPNGKRLAFLQLLCFLLLRHLFRNEWDEIAAHRASRSALTWVAEVRRCTNLQQTYFSLGYERVTPYF